MTNHAAHAPRTHPNDWDVIVIGGGPAGLSAALMLGRARRRVLVIDAGSPRNRFASHMHGVLANDGTPPAELIERGRTEAAVYGVQFVSGAVDRVDVSDHGVVVSSSEGRLSARAVVVATGLTDELPSIPGLAERWGRSVLHCPYCHGWEVRDQRLGVIAISPLSLHQIELVRQWSDHVVAFTAELGAVEDATLARLRSRGVVIVDSPVVEVLGDGDRVSGVRTEDGLVIEVDAIFSGGMPRPHDHFLTHLDLERAENPMGSFLLVDATGRTSNPRIWAAGNVVVAGATVPMAMGAGATVGGAVNGALVAEDFDAAVALALGAAVPSGDEDPADFWEQRYSGTDQSWSGSPNYSLVDVVAGLAPGRALDLGCGEGADAVWLAEQGWDVTGIDISATAVARATAAAAKAGLGDDRVRFVATDLDAWSGDGEFDLITASFFHSPVPLERTGILRRAAARVAPGGHLLIVSHAAPPPGVEVPAAHLAMLLSPEAEVDALTLPSSEWTTVIAETRPRPLTRLQAHAGHGVDEIDDVIVLLRRST